MEPLKTAFQRWLKKVASDSHAAIVSIIVTSIVALGIGGIYLFFENLWRTIIDILQSPTPLWVTIAVTLLLLIYVYVKSKSAAASHSSISITKYFNIGKYKWKATIHDDWFEVEKYPFCKKHDLQFIFSTSGKRCPGTDTEKCDSILRESEEFKVYESAKSIIDNKIRNNEYER